MERFLMALTPSRSSRTVRQEVLQREIQNGMFTTCPLPSGGELYSIYPGSHVCYGTQRQVSTVTLRFALILLPALVIVTAFIGYRFTRRTLMPVKKITDTVREIRADADLSRRIGITDKGGKHRDEIYTLADTFDGMLSELDEAFQRKSSLHRMCPMNCAHR